MQKNNKKAVILDFRADREITDSLNALGFEVIPSFNASAVSENLCGHPDIQICRCGERTFVCSPECYEYYNKILNDFGVRILEGNTPLESHYPFDIAYNVAWIGNKAVHNFKYTDKILKESFDKSGCVLINVSQGYSKCNICIVSDNAAITSDCGIYDALNKNGVDTLLINGGNIDIFGWDYGFIGGASGKIDDSTLTFCGDVSSHPDGDRIVSFCHKYSVNCISLSKKRLIDLGSVIPV